MKKEIVRKRKIIRRIKNLLVFIENSILIDVIIDINNTGLKSIDWLVANQCPIYSLGNSDKKLSKLSFDNLKEILHRVGDYAYNHQLTDYEDLNYLII